MKKAFTLVELLVVTLVIAILASIAFQIAGIGKDSKARNLTVARMQRLENAISGYFAAYGSYPPVALQGRSRNIFYEVSGYGIQQTSRSPSGNIDLGSNEGWKQVETACRAQPVAMLFPYNKGYFEYVRKISETLKELHESGAEGYRDNPALAYGFDALEQPEDLSSKYHKGAWTDTQLFQFGLISYLLPRYIVMMGHDADEIYDKFDQWGDNNSMPSRFEDGVQYGSWGDINQALDQNDEKWKIALLPTQAVTARWMANFENTLTCNIGRTIYGVNVMSDSSGALSIGNPWPKIFSSGDSQSGTGTSGSQQYVLDEITCRDGWYNDFYYYSMPPYQSYRLWSAGPNGKTFPPWIADEDIDNDSRLSRYKNTIRNWIADDIVHMSN